MATFRIKRVTFNNVPVAIKQGTGSYRPTSEELTPVVDSNGLKIFDTSEPQVGMMKMEASVLKTADENLIRDFRDGEIVMEFVNGKTVVGSLMSQTANNDVTETDGVLVAEFSGNVVVR